MQQCIAAVHYTGAEVHYTGAVVHCTSAAVHCTRVKAVHCTGVTPVSLRCITPVWRRHHPNVKVELKPYISISNLINNHSLSVSRTDHFTMTSYTHGNPVVDALIDHFRKQANGENSGFRRPRMVFVNPNSDRIVEKEPATRIVTPVRAKEGVYESRKVYSSERKRSSGDVFYTQYQKQRSGIQDVFDRSN